MLAIFAMIDHSSNGDSVGQLRDAARVVFMKMCQQHNIKLFDPRSLGRRQDALRIAALIAGPASVDQQRLAARRHKQCRLPAFHVHEVNL